MTITLSSELDQFLEQEVAEGRYASVTEAISVAVERLRRERAAEVLKGKLAEGIRDLEEGRLSEVRTSQDAQALRSRILQKASCATEVPEGV